MKFFDASRYASPLRKALAKKENAPRNLRFETLENRALLSVTPLDELQAAVASAEIAPAQTVEAPVVDLSALAVSNATLESNADDQYEGENGNNAQANAYPLGTLTEMTKLEAFAGTGREQDWYRVNFQYAGTADAYLRLETPEGGVHVNNLYFALKSKTGGNQAHTVEVVDDRTKVISLAEIPAGEYTVEVYYNGSGSSPYTLTIEPPKPETDDRYENVADGVVNNDSFTNAYDLDMVGDLTLKAKAGPSRNDDYFKFTMVGTGTAEHQIVLSTAANAVLNFRVFKEGATDDVDSAILKTLASGDSTALSLKDLEAGDYYVQVENNNAVDSFVEYSLTFNAPKDAPAEPTNLETNGDEAKYNYTTLSWDAVDYVTGYELRYTADVDATEAEANWKPVGTVAADVTEFTTDKLGLAYGTEYKFQVRALRIEAGAHDRSVWDLASDWSDACVFQTVEAPEPPTGLKASVLAPETLTVDLSWTDLDNELGYEVKLLDADGETLAQSGLLEAGTTSWTTPALALGTTYQFQVTAINNAGDATSEPFSFTTENVPTAPTGESWTLVPAPQPTATLSWSAVENASDAEAVANYVVTIYEQIDGADGDAIFTQTVDAAQTALTLEAGLLEKGASYRFDVVAVNAYGESAPSNGEGAYVTVGDVLVAPTELRATVNASTEPTATLSWIADENATAYEVTLYQIVVDADGETTVVAFEPQPVTDATYTTGTLDFGGTYYFEVAAVNAYGKSEVAKSENFTVGTVPTAPTELTADLDEVALTATLSWTAASNHTGYRVELQTQNADGETVWEIVDNLDAAALTWSTDVAVDTTYRYRVVAWNAYGETVSETVEVVVENTPAQPTDLEYEFNHDAKNAILTWTAVEGADAYVVEQLGDDGEWAPVAPPVGNPETTETTWESGAFDFGTSHVFRVVAKNVYGSSVASDAVSFTIQDEPTVVTSLKDGDLNLLDGVTTLREALYFAQDGATITFAEDLRGGTITLTGGPLSIMEKEISVRGFVDETGAPELTIDGANKDMVFVVSNTRASFFGLSVVNGYASYAKYGGGARGGGFSVVNANANFTNVDVINCHADAYGGGIYIGSNVEAPGQGKSTLTNVRILDNASDNGESSGLGGGLYATGDFMGGEIEMTNVEISGNQARGDGGGVFLNDITSTLTNVKITDNIAQGNGGAFYANAPDHTFTSNLTGYPLLLISTKLTNVEISGNQAYKGFGFYADEFDVEELSLRNVTLADNVGTQEGASGDVYLANGVATFYNSIVDGDVQGEEYAANAYNTLSSYAAWANATDEGVVNYVLNEGDSVFAKGSYALAADSVARNKGDNAYVPETLTTDLAGNPRVVNGTVDLGAYEGSEAASTVVTITADVVNAYDGEISLREALAYAKSGETVSFAEDLRGQTITLKGEELKIAKALTIQGLVDETGAPQITIDADGKSRVFNVAAGNARKPVSISGLKLIGGNATNGGAVYVAWTKTANFTNVIFTGNTATSYGGGVHVDGTANFENATFSGNQADYGAVARVDGTATFTNNVISENNATSYGGGVFVGKSGTAEFEGNEISDNTATKYGGGVYVSGTATFLNDEIAGNTANRYGGGLYVAGTATLTGATIAQNQAPNGGGLYVAGTATLTGATIAQNQAANGAGAYVVNGGTVDATKGQFTGNIATYYGGGAYVANGGTANFESATLSGNQADYGAVARVDGTATFMNNVISENNATSYGGVFVGKSGTAEFEGNKISGNTATKYGGGVYVNGTATFLNDEIVGNTAKRYGGGLYVAGTATLTGATIAQNQAANGAGAYVVNGGTFDATKGQFTGNIATYYGGVAYVANGGTANFESATLSGNQADYGAVARVDGTATFTNNVISKNNATSYGGVFVGKSGTAEFEGNEISGNTATKYGGGVYVNGTATFLNDEIVGNTAKRYGGGLYVAGTATLTGATIAENQAANGAGAYVVNGGTANFEDSTLEDAVVGNVVISDSSDATPTSAAFADAFDELDFFVDEDELDALAKRLI